MADSRGSEGDFSSSDSEIGGESDSFFDHISSEDERRDADGQILPYMFEPEVESGDEDDEIPGVHNDKGRPSGSCPAGRIGNVHYYAIFLPSLGSLSSSALA